MDTGVMRMEKMERVQAALAGKSVDRPPVSVWMHYPDVDQDALALAHTQVAFQQKYDLDFIKLMPFGLYSAQDWGCRVQFFCDRTRPPIVLKNGIANSQEWKNVQPLPAHFGNWGQQLQLADYTVQLTQGKIPVIQTIFSPLTTAYKLAGDRIFRDMKESPDWVHQALQAIARTTMDSVIENSQRGISGIFFATQCATVDLMTPEGYSEFGRPYDLEVLEAANQAGLWFNLLHIHGNNIMFSELADYPVQALNWHDRQVWPSLQEARGLCQQCLIGGIHEKGAISYGQPEEVMKEIGSAISAMGTNKLMIAPGCVTEPYPPEANLFAARLAVEPDVFCRFK